MPDRRLDIATALFCDLSFDSGRFSPTFSRNTPAEGVRTLIRNLEDTHGAFEDVVVDGDDLVVRLQRAEVTVNIALDEADRVRGLRIQPAVVTTGEIEDHAAAIAALPGATAVLVVRDGAPIYAHNADAPLAVGSAFKVGVLAAVARAVSRGELAWDQTAAFAETWRSLPSGLLQAWPAGVPLTIMSLACLMISLSDNTATDALIDLVGRGEVEALVSERPLLTTREAFILKAAGNEAERRAWLDGDAEARRGLLQTLSARPAPAVHQLAGDFAPQVEWHLSADALFALLRETADLAPFRINPGPLPPSRWSQIAYKGGGEPSVLNVSLRLISRKGAEHGVVATFNGAEDVDRERLLGPVRAIARRLEDV